MVAVGGTRGFFQGSLETCSCLTKSRVEGVAGKVGLPGAPHPPGPFFPYVQRLLQLLLQGGTFPRGGITSHRLVFFFFFVFSFFGKKNTHNLKVNYCNHFKV